MPPQTAEPATDTTPSTPPTPVPWWDCWFEVTARGSRLGTEIRAGVVTFLTM